MLIKTIHACCVYLLLGLTASLAALNSSANDFERYRVILERQPFGEIVPDESADFNAVSAANDSLTRELEMRAIIDDGDNLLRVGFLDKQSNKTFYLAIGETNENYELLSVDYDSEEAVLRRGTESSLFTLKPNQNQSPATPTALAAASSAALLNAPLAETERSQQQSFAPFPLPDAKKPFFSDIKKQGFSPFKPMGTNTPLPFRAQSFEGFMKAHTNIGAGLPGAFRPFTPDSRGDDKEDSIANFLRTQPEGTHQFAPLTPLEPSAEAIGRGSTIESFMISNPDQEQPPPLPLPDLEDLENLTEE